MQTRLAANSQPSYLTLWDYSWIPPYQVGKVEFRLAEKGLDTLVEGLGFSMILNTMGLPNSPAQTNTGRTITVPPNTCKAHHMATELPGRAEIQGNRLLDWSYSR